MAKRAVSVTLEIDNLAWLEGQVAGTRARGLSGVLDRIVTDARMSGRVDSRAVRSVVGTVEINPADPFLDEADRHVRSLFDASLSRPWTARKAPMGDERAQSPQPGKSRKRRRHG